VQFSKCGAAQGGIAKLSVGNGMRSRSGVAAKMFELLGNADINIQMISTSEIKISVVIDEARVDQGANLVHAGFGLDRTEP
jgi:aspartate kinase